MNSAYIDEARRARAEAVAWMARLQGPDRSKDLELGLREWIARSPANAAAFEQATDLWEELGGVSAAAVLKHRPSAEPRSSEGRRRQWLLGSAAAAAAVLVAAVALVAFEGGGDIATQVGEQRSITLSDGSRMALNTDTRVVVEPWVEQREVRLERGEAYFEVAKNPQKPFVVIAGAKRIVALGTAFVVRLLPGEGDERVSVTLVEGRVAVSDLHPSPARTTKPALLMPGERLVAKRDEPVAVDRPRIDAITAWRRGEIVLDNTRLAEAVQELNRYSGTRISLAKGPLEDIPVSGIFRTGDSEAFAASVSALYDLAASRDGEVILLFPAPRKP